MKNADTYPQLVLRLALGIGFLLPVCDRLGILGAPGEKNVNWGNWENFANYTNLILPVVSPAVANFLGAIVSILEVVFGFCLILGFKTRLMALGSALLTLIFGILMAIFLGIYAPFGYPVFVFTGGGILLSCVEKFKWSLDDLAT
ncbi:DoxX protein [Dyadobacter koreensis]|uniref:DoxX protein n=1 Tax=Dyadobacter koreensis TaxID=408657 RepID=A0A1H6YFL0_9BACT|nr:DoxX family protein [Dyadobacter koreensis]SEJ40029.1 DoxX protein [Dyadobacter koreensis]